MVEADKGGHWEGKKRATADSVVCVLGAWVEGENCFKQKKKKEKKKSFYEGSRQYLPIYILIKGELHKHKFVFTNTNHCLVLILREAYLNVGSFY